MTKKYEFLAIGSSAGGIEALKTILPRLPADYPLSIGIVQHIGADSPQILAKFFSELCAMKVKEAEDKEPLCPGTIYFAPAGYHLLVSKEQTFHLSVDEPVHFARPSIDVLFETAALSFGNKAIAAVLTGANDDGAAGLSQIKKQGGLTLAQDPSTAHFPTMPQAAIDLRKPDFILSLEGIANFLVQLTRDKGI